MNGVWKSALEKNYLRSLDYRSYDFRQVDKKQYTARYMYQELKEKRQTVEYLRYQSDNEEEEGGGENGKPTMSVEEREELLRREWSESTDPSKPVAVGILPPSREAHLAFKFRDITVFKDVVKVLWYALEQGSVSSAADRSPSFSLWKDFLRVFFGIPIQYMFSMQPLLPKDIIQKEFSAHEARSVGTEVFTLLGKAKVKEFRNEDGSYALDLCSNSGAMINDTPQESWGVAYVRPTAILAVNELNDDDLNLVGVKVSTGRGNSRSNERKVEYEESWNATSSSLRSKAKEVSKEDELSEIWTEMDDTNLPDFFVGTSSMYLVIRLLAMLSERIKLAREFDSSHTFKSFMTSLLAVLDGQIDSYKFEDSVRELYGNKAFILFNMDRVVAQTVKQIHNAGTDPFISQMMVIYHYQKQKRQSEEFITQEERKEYIRQVEHVFKTNKIPEEIYIFSRINSNQSSDNSNDSTRMEEEEEEKTTKDEPRVDGAIVVNMEVKEAIFTI